MAANLSPPPDERKLFLGPRLRRIRRELGITQGRMAEREDPGSADRQNPVDRVRAFLETSRNHFTEVDAAAEQLHGELGATPDQMFAALSERLRERHGIRARIMPIEVMPENLRRY